MSKIEQLQKRFSTVKTPFNKWISQPSYISQLDNYLKGMNISNITEKKIWYTALSEYALLYPTETKIKNLRSDLQKLCLNDEMDETDEIKIIKISNEIPKKITVTNKSKIAPKVTSSLIEPNEQIIFDITDSDDSKLKNASKIKILDFIIKAHEILHSAETICGMPALNDIMNLLFLKAIAPILSDKIMDNHIDLLNKEYYTEIYDDDTMTDIFEHIKDINNISLLPSDAIRSDTAETDIIKQIGTILSLHPITKQMFTEINFIKAKKALTIKTLIAEINTLDINDLYHNEDTIGDIYEYFINAYCRGDTKLGQFFTPRRMMQMLLSYKKDKFEMIIRTNDSDNEKTRVLDTCMGTGGWLVTFYNMYKDVCPNRLLLSGNDVEPSTFQYGLMNLILTLRGFPYDMNCADSLTHVNQDKHHIIITNPPFKTTKNFSIVETNFTEDKYTKDNKIKLTDIYKLHSNNSPVQFLELNSYKLHPGGISIIILPYGELFSGKSSKKMRECFINKYNITDIIVFPEGIFTHTSIKTAAFIYENTGHTKEINFIKANLECTILTKIFTLNTDIIKSNANVSWHYTDYLSNKITSFIKEDITCYKLGDICSILIGGTPLTSNDEYYTNGTNLWVSIKDLNYGYLYNTKKKITDLGVAKSNVKLLDIGTILLSFKLTIGKTAIAGVPLYTNEAIAGINSINHDTVLNKYLFYYFSIIDISDAKSGIIGNGSLNKDKLNNLIIRVPSIKKQTEIIAYLDHIYVNIIKHSHDFTTHIITQNHNYLENIIKLYDNDNVPFGAVFKLTKGKIQSSKVIEHDDGITLVTGAKQDTFKKIIPQDISYIKDGLNIFISTNGNGNSRPVRFHHGECNYSNLMAVITIKDDTIVNLKYIYYFLSYKQSYIEEIYQKGSCNKVLDIDNFNKMLIVIPSIDVQNSIVTYLDSQYNLMNTLRSNILSNTNASREYLNSII